MLSIIVPIYNGEYYLDKFMKNLENQTFRDFELILVNDGSVDKTQVLCENYKNKDSRIKVINKINEGAGPARNAGISIAKGEYLMFVDCDDYFENNYLEILYNTISSNNVDLVICGQIDVIEAGAKKIKYNKVVPPNKKYNNKIEIQKDYIKLKEIGIADVLWNKIYSSDVIKKNKLKFPNLRRGQDTVFNINYFNNINSCITIEKPLYYYRIDALKNIFDKFPKNHYEIICKENEDIEKIVKVWGVYNDDTKLYLNSHFIKAVFGALTNAFNPKWNFNLLDKYRYIRDIINKKKVKEKCENQNRYSKYEKLMLICVRNNLVLLLMILLKVKVIKRKLAL